MKQWLGSPHRLANLRLRNCGEGLERGLANAQRLQFVLAELFGTARQRVHSALNEYPAELQIGGRGGDVSEGSQQPQTDCDVGFRIHADLLKGCFQQTVEVDPCNACARNARRIAEQFIRRLTGREADQDTAQLIDAGDRGRRVVDGERDCLQRNIDDLRRSKLHVLLQGSCRSEIERGTQSSDSLGGHPVALETIISGIPTDTRWPTCRRTRMQTWYCFARATKRRLSMKRM